MKSNLSKIYVLFILLFGSFLLNSSAFAFVSAIDDLHKYSVTEDEKFDKIFREGRDLIDKEEWAKAAAKFNQIVCDCPDKQYVDAAFYWLAFSYKKQKMYKEMNEAIDRLTASFPNSSWIDDARVMKYESGMTVYAIAASRPSAGGYPSVNGVPMAVAGNAADTILATSPQTPLDREDEIKLAAFQSLLSANQPRAIEVLGELLKSGSKASETLKREILRSLRNQGAFAADVNTRLLTYSNSVNAVPKVKDQILPQLRETLFKGYRNESNVKVRSEIIYTLSSLNDEESTNYIVQLYSSEQNKDLKKAVINSFGGSQFYALSVAGNPNLLKKPNFDKLFEILRTEKDAELRRLALSNLQRFSAWSTNAGMIETLSQIYDSEADEEFKTSIIRSFTASKQKQAYAKLLEIAKKDKNDKLRLEAIRALRSSSDPEVAKFLESLIK